MKEVREFLVTDRQLSNGTASLQHRDISRESTLLRQQRKHRKINNRNIDYKLRPSLLMCSHFNDGVSISAKICISWS